MEDRGTHTRELGRDEWPLYFDRLSRQYEGTPVTVELTSEYTGIRTMARHAPLVGITVEQDGKDQEVIQVLIGESTGAMMTHAVIDPEDVLVIQPADGMDREIEIRCANGNRLLIIFEQPGAAVDRHVPPQGRTFRQGHPPDDVGKGPFGPQPGM